MVHWSFMLAAEAPEQQAVLLGFDATMPFIVIEFLVLMAVLKALFFKPMTEAIDSREDYVRTTLSGAKEKLEKSEALARQYKQEIAQMRLKAQAIIAEAEAGATKIRNQQVLEAQQAAQARVEAARLAVEQEKQTALQELNAQVTDLSDRIAAKLIGAVANG